MKKLTIKTVNKEIKSKYGEYYHLHKGTHRFYIQFDNGEVLVNRSVYVEKINDLNLDYWMWEAHCLSRKVDDDIHIEEGAPLGKEA